MRSRILLVEDEDDIASSLQDSLLRTLNQACDVEVAHSALEAKERINREHFDLVISDERMPGMRGSELLAWLRWEHPEVRRALMSAFPDSFTGPLARRAGAHLKLQKPLDLRSLGPALRATLREPESGMPPASP
ncbi:MAG: response regulator [Halobacteriales archaeon]|nr:response regulator [Halobacteriales archaeon]